MARKRTRPEQTPAEVMGDDPATSIQRPPAEVQFAAEWTTLAAADAGKPRPQGWKLTPQSVVQFVLGDEALGVAPKFVGKRSFVERCVVALATHRGLMLIGQPGTARSWLSELRAGQGSDGNAPEPLTTAMSTAEAVSTGCAAGLHAWYYGGGPVQAEHLVQHLIGTALEDAPDNLEKLRHYFNHVVKGRPGRGWQAFYEAREQLP